MKASLAMLMKTNVGKMSVFGVSTMFMKINDLDCYYHDVYEKKGGYRLESHGVRGEGERAIGQFSWPLVARPLSLATTERGSGFDAMRPPRALLFAVL